MPAAPLDVASAFVKAINQEDLGALRDTMTEDHTFTDALGRSFSGAEKMIEGWRLFFDAYPEYWIRVGSAFVEGSRVALFGEAGGKWKVDGFVLPRSWTVAAAWLAEVREGKVSRWAVYCDTSWTNPPASASEEP